MDLRSFAVVVVIDARDQTDAYDRIAGAHGDEVQFVGAPWEVEPITPAPDREFSTLECIDQHPEGPLL